MPEPRGAARQRETRARRSSLRISSLSPSEEAKLYNLARGSTRGSGRGVPLAPRMNEVAGEGCRSPSNSVRLPIRVLSSTMKNIRRPRQSWTGRALRKLFRLTPADERLFEEQRRHLDNK